MTRPAVLVVEDEITIRDGICDLLTWHGLNPRPAATGTDGLAEALTGAYDLVMLDVMLPGIDGISICRELRASRPGQAILMLTARGREEDVLEGFRAGCDDYVAKPFSIAQLVARVTALVRRATPPKSRIVLGTLVIDALELAARVGEAEVALTPRDLEVLTYLYAERHRVVPRDDLLRAVWRYELLDTVETRAVDMHIVKLRRKLADVVGDATVIQTIRGAGYRLVAPE